MLLSSSSGISKTSGQVAELIPQEIHPSSIHTLVIDFTARTRLKTTGHFGSKKVVGVTWEGGKLAEDLNADSELNEMIVNQSVNDATIFVDPTDNGIRIYGKWKNSLDFGITKELQDPILNLIKENFIY